MNVRSMSRVSVFLFVFVAMYGSTKAQEDSWGTYYVSNCGSYDTRDPRETFLETLREAVFGDIWSQDHVGFCYEYGVEVEQDYEKAFDWYLEAAKRNYTPAIEHLIRCYENGVGTEKDLGIAAEWREKIPAHNTYDYEDDDYDEIKEFLELFVCKDNVVNYPTLEESLANAYYKIGERYFLGQDVGYSDVFYYSHASKNQEKAFSYFSKAAELGNVWAQNQLGHCYAMGIGIDRDAKKAFDWFYKAAQQKDPVAQNNVGICYRDGVGVAKNLEQAFSWFFKSAQQENVLAQCDLGCFFENNHDYKAAAKWYLKAAKQNLRESQYRLGFLYYLGRGVEKDLEKAFSWGLKAAKPSVFLDAYKILNLEDTGFTEEEKGLAAAQNFVGCCYFEGWGVEKNYQEAFVWFLRAAEQGDVSAQKNLALCYENGFGVEQDQEQANFWLEKAQQAESIEESARDSLPV